MSSNDNSLELFMNDLAELPKILEWFSDNADKIPIGLTLEHLKLSEDTCSIGCPNNWPLFDTSTKYGSKNRKVVLDILRRKEK